MNEVTIAAEYANLLTLAQWPFYLLAWHWFILYAAVLLRATVKPTSVAGILLTFFYHRPTLIGLMLFFNSLQLLALFLTAHPGRTLALAGLAACCFWHEWRFTPPRF